ncbi:hypothetical protein JOM56_000004 [Amanita muscaria]
MVIVVVRCFCRRWPHPIRNGRISLSRKPMKTPARHWVRGDDPNDQMREPRPRTGCDCWNSDKDAQKGHIEFLIRPFCETEIGQGSRDHRSYWNLGLYISGAIAADCGIFLRCVMSSDVDHIRADMKLRFKEEKWVERKNAAGLTPEKCCGCVPGDGNFLTGNLTPGHAHHTHGQPSRGVGRLGSLHKKCSTVAGRPYVSGPWLALLPQQQEF